VSPEPMLKYEIRPVLRDLQGRFAKMEGELLEMRREQLRGLGRFGVKALREEAPKGKTGKFAKSHGYRTDLRTRLMSLTFYSAEPLGTWLREGTRRHWVAPVQARVLHWVTEAGQHAFSMGHYVSGIKPIRYHERALDKMRPEIDVGLRKIGSRVVQRLAGQ